MSKNTSKSMVVAKNNHPLPTTPKLTANEQTELKECEKIISKNYQSIFESAQALHRIHDKKLYRFEYDTFEEYCSKKWEYGRSYCHRLITMDGEVGALELYEKYQDWCQAHQLVAFPSKEFHKMAKNELELRFGLRYRHDLESGNGGVIRGWKGLALGDSAKIKNASMKSGELVTTQ